MLKLQRILSCQGVFFLITSCKSLCISANVLQELQKQALNPQKGVSGIHGSKLIHSYTAPELVGLANGGPGMSILKSLGL